APRGPLASGRVRGSRNKIYITASVVRLEATNRSRWPPDKGTLIAITSGLSDDLWGDLDASFDRDLRAALHELGELRSERDRLLALVETLERDKSSLTRAVAELTQVVERSITEEHRTTDG